MPLPLDLYGEVTTASGNRYKLDANQEPGSRPQNLSFRTKIGEGFSDGSFQLARRIDKDYPDLNLVNTITFTGADGSVAYEGRNSAMPRDLGDRHSIGVTLAGWIAHARDKKFVEIYVSRDTSAWLTPPLPRRVAIATGSALQVAAASSEAGGITWSLPATVPDTQLDELWWIAPPGVTASTFGYVGARTTYPATMETPLLWSNASRDGTGSFTSAALTLDGTSRSVAVSNVALMLRTRNATGGVVTPTVGAQQQFSKLAVYGSHGLTLYTGETGEPAGVYASDVMRDIAGRFCPQLDTSGIQNSDYVIQHCAFPTPTDPYDAWLEINKYHLWNFGVWEDKRLDFAPYDLSDYDWEIRTDEPGTTFSPQGPTTENLFNGAAVTYTNPLTGIVDRLTPDTYTGLRDTSSTNPWNQHGLDKWDEITLSSPTTPASALNLGGAALADRNRAKTPGTITVRGYIRDRAGNLQPAWKVRAGQTISITNFPNDTPRLIVETDYDDETKTVRLAIDLPFAILEAYLDRQANALQARGLG